MIAPPLAVGDGAMGFRAALEDVYARTCQQRCGVHKSANVVNSDVRYQMPFPPISAGRGVLDQQVSSVGLNFL